MKKLTKILQSLNTDILIFDKSENDYLNVKYEVDDFTTYSEFVKFIKSFSDKIDLPIGYKIRISSDSIHAEFLDKRINIYFKYIRKHE